MAPFSALSLSCSAPAQALEQLAPAMRLELAQADDAARFGANPDDPVARRTQGRAARIAAALEQQPGQPVPMEELVVTLYALQEGLADGVAPAQVSVHLQRGLDALRAAAPGVLPGIAKSKLLTAADERRIRDAFAAL